MIIEDRYYLRNQETFELVEVSKEIYEQYQEEINVIKKLFNPDRKIGKVFVYGTAGEIPSDKLKEIWYNPEEYKLQQDFIKNREEQIHKNFRPFIRNYDTRN